jgi:hypothetical protein
MITLCRPGHTVLHLTFVSYILCPLRTSFLINGNPSPFANIFVPMQSLITDVKDPGHK